MSVRIEELGINHWSVRDRLELIEQIWDSLPAEVRPEEVPDWHRAELPRRRAEAEASPRAGVPWRDALDSLEPGR